MATRPKGFRSIDLELNPVLAAQTASMRGNMQDAAERVPLPPRFVATENPATPSMFLFDKETGRTIIVSLCDYYGVRKALADLFRD